MKKLLAVVVLVVGHLLWAAPARATLVTPTDLATVDLGTQYGGDSLTSNFLTPDLTSQGGSASHSIGTLVDTVYYNTQTQLYTYVLAVSPTVSNPTDFSTQFNVYGFDPTAYGTRAGWSYSDATNAGVVGSPSSAFYILWTLHNGTATTLDWTVKTTQLLSGFWSNEATITFFLQSIYRPELNWYNLAGSQVGATLNYAPDPPVATPEPTSLLLLTTGLIGGGYWFGRSRRRSG